MSQFCVAALGKGQPFPADRALTWLICGALKCNDVLTHHTFRIATGYDRGTATMVATRPGEQESQRVRVSEYMTRKVITAAPEDGVRQTFFRMREARIRHLPVLQGAQLIGMLSDRDLRRPDWVDEAFDLSYDYQLDDNLSVSDLMSHHPVSVHTYDHLGRACELINRHGFGALPVLDKGNHLVGIISKADLVRAFGKVLQSNRENIA